MFKKITNQTFIEFLNKYKISRAEEFLLYTNDSISDIANELGFCNTNYFDKVFRSVNGCSPSAFRKQTGKLNPEGSL
jgi:two-component system response regulator YesN